MTKIFARRGLAVAAFNEKRERSRTGKWVVR